MMIEEKLLHEFLKENNLFSLELSWATAFKRYYFAFDSNNKEVHFYYNVENETIVLTSLK